MLIKQLIESPATSSKLVVLDPFRDVSREELVKEVIGLANAEVDGPRNILFGVNPGAVDGNRLVGIHDEAVAELKKAHRLLSALIEPVLELAFIYDIINGKLVGALEIDGCDFGPYFVGHDLSESLSRGQCWVREDRKLRAVERAELMQGSLPEAANEPEVRVENADISVGFLDDPESEYLELAVPDTSDPPFADQKNDDGKPSKFTTVIRETVGTVTTRLKKLGNSADDKIVAEFKSGSKDEAYDGADQVLVDARNHYYYEEKALQLNLCACNKGSETITDISIELGFPRLPDFDIADRLYTSPFDKRSPQEIRNMGYPEVESCDDAIYARSSLDELAPGRYAPVFRCALRMAVGPRMQTRKMAILYTLRGPSGQELGTGRLKIRFSETS